MPSILQLLFSFPDLALRPAVGGHPSTQTCLVEPSCSLLLSCFTRVWHQFLGCRSRLFHESLSCLHSLLSRCFTLPGALRLFWTKSALLSELPVSALLRTLLSCAPAPFIYLSCTFWIIDDLGDFSLPSTVPDEPSRSMN